MNDDEAEDTAPHLPDAAEDESSSSSSSVVLSPVKEPVSNVAKEVPPQKNKEEQEKETTAGETKTLEAKNLKKQAPPPDEDEVISSASSEDDENEGALPKQSTAAVASAAKQAKSKDKKQVVEKEDLVDASAQTIKSGFKRKPSSSSADAAPESKRPKSAVDEELSPEEIEKKRKEIIEKGKAEFELEKKKVLDELTKEYKARFGEIVFAKFGKDWFASLILSPYDVAPGAVRDDWMTMFKNTEGRRDKMTYLVYYYGTTNEKEFYGFHPTSQIVSYEEGQKKGCHKLSKAGEKKLAEGKKLAKKDQEKKKALDEMEEDRAKKPEERKRGVWPFKELFEIEAFIHVMLTEPKEGEEGEKDDISVASSESDDSQVPMDSSEDEGGKSPSPPKKAVKPQARPRGRPPKKGMAKATPPSDAPISPTKDVEMEEIGDAEKSSVADNQEDDAAEPSSSSDDDMDDADYVGEGKKTAGRQKKPPSEKKPKEKVEGKKRQLQRKRTKKSKKAKEAEERDRYLESLDKCLTPLRVLRKAVKKENDATKAEAAMKELLGLVESMAGTFIQQSGVVSLVKEAKQLLKSQKADLSTYKRLFELLKTTHEKKKDQIPDVKDLKKLTEKWWKKWANSKKPSKSETPRKERPETTAKKETAATATPSKTKPEQKFGTGVAKSEPIPRTEPPKAAPSRPSTEASRSLSQTSTGSLPKTEKKSFSLGSFVRPSKTTSVVKDEKTPAQGPRVKDPRLSIEKTKALPQWLTSPPSEDPGFSSNQDRTFAIEFIQGAASQLPSDKVNKDYFSRALEAAIYNWTREKITLSWQDDYWQKVHSIVGAICGKRKPGALAKQIVAGEFDSARAIVELDDDALFRSFEDGQ